MAKWAEQHGVLLDFIQSGKPAQNAYIERFNRTFREDVLDAHIFNSITETQLIAMGWLEDYNANRPHEALDGMPHYDFSAGV